MRNYNDYMNLMAQLQKEDYKNRFDKDERENHKLTEAEILVDKVMSTERESIIGNKHIYKEYLPVMMFYDACPMIDKTNTYQILRTLPKGGNLHIHSSSTWDAPSFANYLNDTYGDNVYIQADDTKADYGTLQYWLNTASIKVGYITLKQFIAKNGVRGVVDLITFNSANMAATDDAWDTFNTIFSRVSGIIKVKPIYKEYYKRAFLTSYEDNVKYLEVRMGMGSLVDSNDPENKDKGTSADETLEITYNLYKEFQKDGHEDFICKLIISTSRGTWKLDDVLKLMKQAQDWQANRKDDGEDFIVGFDFVSEEDVNFKTDYYAETICENNISLDFYFHDGESNWADDDNVMSAFALGTKRIGHGLNLYRFPELMERIMDKSICLEVCPISNQLLRYTQDLRVHPIGEYMKRGVPVTICSDDPQIFGNKGLTYDFWEVYFGQQADMCMIKQAIVNSYQYSALPDGKKTNLINKWRLQWKETTEKLVSSDLLYCAAMFEGYYDEVKADGPKSDKKLHALNTDDMAMWKKYYYDMVKKADIVDGEFFNNDPSYGVGNDGTFVKVEYCNIMYRLYKYLYNRRRSEKPHILKDKKGETNVVNKCIDVLEKYVDYFKGKGTSYNLTTGMLPDDTKTWKEECYPQLTALNLFPDGSFFGDVHANANYGVGADGVFSSMELLHFLYQCYKFKFYNYIYE
jgi:adenosine deaminase CECR1